MSIFVETILTESPRNKDLAAWHPVRQERRGDGTDSGTDAVRQIKS